MSAFTFLTCFGLTCGALARYRPVPVGRALPQITRKKWARRQPASTRVIGERAVQLIRPGATTNEVVARSIGFSVLGFALGLAMFNFTLAIVLAVVLGSLPYVDGARHRKKVRAMQIRDLVNVCDLLDLAASSGLTVGQSLEIVAEEHRGALGGEIRRVIDEVHRGIKVIDALNDADIRTDGVLTPLVLALTDAYVLGSPLRDALRNLRDQVENDLRIRAETRARKAPTLMIFPLAMFVMPAFILLTITPIVVSDLSALHGVFS